jgi:hypothetical protein
MRENDLASVQKDDSVMIRRNSRGETWHHATVVKAGPVWLTVKGDRPHAAEERYRRDNRGNGTGYSQHGMVYTMAEYERIQADHKARETLRNLGIDLRLNNPWERSGHLVKLADAVRAAWNDVQQELAAQESTP